MAKPTQTEVTAALRRYLREGVEHDWDRVVDAADSASLLVALATELAVSTEQEGIILRKLTTDIARRRPELLKSFNSRVVVAKSDEKYRSSLFEMMDLLKAGVPEIGSRDDLLGKINERVAGGCTTLKIGGRIRKDVIAADLEEEALDGRSLSNVLDLNNDGVLSVARKLTEVARGDRWKRQAASKRARLMLQTAKILILAPRPEDRMQEIRRAIGSYCCRQAQVYSEDRHETDAAQDYALEAVRYQDEDRWFPVALYFHTALVQFHKQQGSDFIPQFKGDMRAEKILSGDNSSPRLLVSVARNEQERMRILGLALLRLAFYDRDLAVQLFNKLSPPAKDGYVHALSRCLMISEKSSSFDLVVSHYRKRMTSLHETLNQAIQAGSLLDIGAYSTRFAALTGDSILLVSFDEQQALKEITQASARGQQAAAEIDPPSRRALLRTARDSLRRAEDHGRSLSFGILYIEPIVRAWGQVIERGIDESLRLIRPSLSVQAYRNTFIRRGENGLVQLQVQNSGKGVATAISVVASWLGLGVSTKLEREHLTPGQDALLTLSGPLGPDVRHIDVDVKVICTDVEGSQIEFNNRVAFSGPPPNFDFEEKRNVNPFNAGDIVKDPEMFMGREGPLSQLQHVVTSTPHVGALRIVFGQKRVGKSSILYFLDKRLAELKSVPVICGSVSWLNFPKHRPGAVVFEIAKAVVTSAKKCGLTLPDPIENDYRETYSLRFNGLLDQLFALRPMARLALLLDEFDKAYHQLTDPDLGYDEPFFDYLRGLSLREGVSIMLAGGEDLPALLRDLGPTFNNARRIRVSYLDNDSITRLIRNKYVEWLDFPDPVIGLIRQLAHGNPYFTQMLCSELYDTACDQHSLQIATRDIETVGRMLVTDRLTIEQMAHLFQMEGVAKSIAPALLYLLSREATLFQTPIMPTDGLAHHLTAEAGSVRQTLNTLLEREVIQAVPEVPSHVRIVMPLFATWFREHCPLTNDSWSLLPQKGS